MSPLTATPNPARGVVHLGWGLGSGSYDVLRSDGPCPLSGSPIMIGSPVLTESFDDSPGDGQYCYRVDDPTTVDSSNELDVTVDSAPPSVSFSGAPSNNTRVNGDIGLAGAATDALSGVASVQLQRQTGLTWVDVGPADTTAPYDGLTFLTTGLADGPYTLHLVATDAAGNTDTSSPLTLILDTTTAATTITAPADGSINRGSFTITFTNSDPATPVTTTATARAHGTTDPFLAQTGLTKTGWVTTAANDGDWDVRLSSVDALGNLPATADTIHVIVDNTAPILTLSSFPNDGDNVRGTVNVTFTTSDALTPTPATKLQIDPPGGGGFVDAVTTPIGGGLAWNTSGLAAGLYALQIVSTDDAGNTTIRPASTVVVKVDNAPPSTPVISPSLTGAQFGLGEISVTYTGGTEATSNTASGLASVVLQTQNQAQVASNTWTTRGLPVTTSPVKWTPQAPDDCLCNVRLVATDHAGNQSISALATNVSIDGFAPLTPPSFHIDRPTTNGPPILTWARSSSGDVVGYRLVRTPEQVVLQGPGGLTPGLRYADVGLPRNGSVDGTHGYDLYAVDRHNNVSTPIHLNFFLDTVAPTAPTMPHAARRAGTATVDVSWSGSTDVLGPDQAPPSGVTRYVVRRAVGAPPATATAGQAACDVAASVVACVDSPPQGATYAYSVFAVDAASNASLAAHAGPVNVPDITPPGAPTAFRVRKLGLIMAFTWNLPKAADLKKVVIVKSKVHSPRTLTDGKVVYSGIATRAKVRQSGGTRAWYRMFAVDRAGNASAGPAILITQPTFRLFPETGSELRGNVKLRWLRSKRASYYNVQLYLGSSRVTQGWPRTTSFSVAKSKLKRGRVYTWYVWPGIGSKARGRYGNIIGKSTFTWLG